MDHFTLMRRSSRVTVRAFFLGDVALVRRTRLYGVVEQVPRHRINVFRLPRVTFLNGTDRQGRYRNRCWR